MPALADIPLIDLSSFLCPASPTPSDAAFPSAAQRATCRAVDAAFRGHGFLLLSGAGLRPLLGPGDVNTAFEQARALFGMGDARKKEDLMQFNRDLNVGYFPQGVEFLNVKRAPDLKEMFNFASHSQAPSSQFRRTPPSFSSWACAFSSSIDALCETICTVLSLALDLPPTFFSSRVADSPKSVYRLIHYPPCRFAPAAAAAASALPLRVGEHTDFGLFTLLFADGPGLQVRGEGEGGEWMSVPVVEEGGVIVNTGAMLAHWTDYRYVATPHRVVAETEDMANRSRISVAVFVNPHMDTVIDPEDVVGVTGAVDDGGDVDSGEREGRLKTKRVTDRKTFTAQEYFDMRVSESLAIEREA